MMTPKEYSEWLVDLQSEGESIFAWAITDYIERYAKQEVIKELERMSDILLEENEHKSVDKRIEELKKRLNE